MRFATWFLAAAMLAVVGCNRPKGGSGEQFATASDLEPAATIPTKSNLKIGEINMPVEVKQTTEGDKITISIAAHGQTFENEVYQSSEGAFNLVDAAGETYNPPLPLLKFPMNVGDTWTWVGSMTSGDEPHKATATISTSSESLLLPSSGATQSILVIVDLSIESGSPTPATRKLRFWFVKQKGLVKRQFGIGSSREPAE